MLESEDRTADKGLSELVSEVRCTIRSLDEDLLRSLVEPLAGRHLNGARGKGQGARGMLWTCGILLLLAPCSSMRG